MRKNNLNKRQELIIGFLEKNENQDISEIIAFLKKEVGDISKVTVNRDLKFLLKLGLIQSEGLARATSYHLSPFYNLVRKIDIDKYFKEEFDKRNINRTFNFEVAEVLNKIFNQDEIKDLFILNDKYLKNIKQISPTIEKKEMERLIIELSWKSSKIEGNTYTLLETEALLKDRKEAKGKKKEEAVMIINHKETLEYIIKNKKKFKDLSISKIEDIHYLLTKKLGISKNLRKNPVGITGTNYRPLDNQHQIKDALEITCQNVNKIKDPFSKVVAISAMIAYIQPFEDGNKRTSRLVGNAVLLANDICPLSYRSADEQEYKKAVIVFYEINNISYFKELFVQQFQFAVDNYFLGE